MKKITVTKKTKKNGRLAFVVYLLVFCVAFEKKSN